MSFIRDDDDPKSVAAATCVLAAAVLLLLLGVFGCAPAAPVGTPSAVRPIAIRTCVPGARVTIDGALNDNRAPLTADANGDVLTNVFGVAFNLHAQAPNHPPYDQVVTFSDLAGHQLLVGPCNLDPSAERGFQILLPAWASTFTDTGERGAVHVEGLRFARADGSTFPWRGTDGFLLYQHWLSDREGIDPIVENWLSCGGLCNARGPNVVRVLGMVTSFSHFHPQEHADYYDQLRPFVDHLWTTFHLRVEFVIFADAQVVMPDRQDEERHAQRVLDALATAENVFLEVANEPFKNIPGEGRAAADIGRQLQNRGPPVASGDYIEPWLTALDYITVHTDRGDEWPRKAKDLLDFRNGDLGPDAAAAMAAAGVPNWRGNRPIVGDEPIGFAEVEIRGSRATSADDAAAFAAASQLFAAGGTFHSDAGLAYGPYGPVQATAAAAFFTAMHFVPPDAQIAEYQRGSADGGPGIGNMPMEHFDLWALRTFCKAPGGVEYCIAIRPTPEWSAIGRDGWTVAEQPRRGLVRLTR